MDHCVLLLNLFFIPHLKVMEAEQTKTRSELVHKETAAKYNAAMGRMKQLEKKLKRAINKSKYVLCLERSLVVKTVWGKYLIYMVFGLVEVYCSVGSSLCVAASQHSWLWYLSFLSWVSFETPDPMDWWTGIRNLFWAASWSCSSALNSWVVCDLRNRHMGCTQVLSAELSVDASQLRIVHSSYF